jgi:anthranilate phosphoribosyltransferase
MVRELLHKLSLGETLQFEEAESFMDAVAGGTVAPSQTAAFLTALRVRGESVAEVAGCAQSLRKHAVPVPHHRTQVFDCCGTGGDNSHSFNISTAASLVVAACGVAVAKHGNRAMSSSCGSADILGNVVALRKELGFRTVFNMLGPLLNPARATHQLIGTATKQIAELLASAAQHLTATKIVTVHNSHGFDEILPTGSNHRYQWLDTDLFTDPIELPLSLQNGYSPADLRGGDKAKNLAILHDVLNGKESAYQVATVLNAGFALVVAECAGDLETGTDMALEAIHAGKAKRLLSDYVAASQETR